MTNEIYFTYSTNDTPKLLTSNVSDEELSSVLRQYEEQVYNKFYEQNCQSEWSLFSQEHDNTIVVTKRHNNTINPIETLVGIIYA